MRKYVKKLKPVRAPGAGSARVVRGKKFFCVVVGSAVGNNEFLPIDTTKVTLKEISAIYRAFCDRHGFGSKDAGTCQVWENTDIIARVSYNGNVWRGVESHKKSDLLYNNTGLVWNGTHWGITPNKPLSV